MTILVPGFFGKLPARGDFVERRVSRDFVEGWDGWLQRSIAASQEQLSDKWLDTYLTSPLWTFASSAGVFGPAPCLGVVMPSIDKVGRYYPMTIAVEFPEEVTPYAMLCAADGWVTRTEQVMMSLLDQDGIDFEVFDDSVAALTLDTTELEETIWSGEPVDVFESLHCQIAEANVVPLLADELGDLLATADAHAHTLWSTAGSERVRPSLLLVDGVPNETAFTALMDGQWKQHGWETRDLSDIGRGGEIMAGKLQPIPSLTADLLVDGIDGNTDEDSLGIEELGIMSSDEPAAVLEQLGVTAEVPVAVLPGTEDEPGLSTGSLVGISASITHRGNVRAANQDACCGRDSIGAWMVADGVGGHGAGELASALAVRVLDDVPLRGALIDRVASLQGGLRLVEQALHLIGRRYGDAESSATTVVALLQDTGQAALAWAGDSRIYRIRDAAMVQLTVDHAATAIAGVDQSNVITRAVGGEDPLELEVRYEAIRAGDRFILCSDGVYRELSEDDMYALSRNAGPQEFCASLEASVLQTPAKDNFTALMVEFRDPTVAYDGADPQNLRSTDTLRKD